MSELTTFLQTSSDNFSSRIVCPGFLRMENMDPEQQPLDHLRRHLRTLILDVVSVAVYGVLTTRRRRLFFKQASALHLVSNYTKWRNSQWVNPFQSIQLLQILMAMPSATHSTVFKYNIVSCFLPLIFQPDTAYRCGFAPPLSATSSSPSACLTIYGGQSDNLPCGRRPPYWRASLHSPLRLA